MRIAVIGAGSMGTLFGGALAAAGHDVWLLHHDATTAAELADRGVTIESDTWEDVAGPLDVHATADATKVGVADLVLVLVNAFQTREALDQHAACVGDATTVLTLQSGLSNYDTLRERYGAERSLGGVTYQGASRSGIGSVEHTSDGVTILGGATDEAAARVGAVLEDAGIETDVVDDPVPYIWDKQMTSIVYKPLGALTRLPIGDIVADDDLRSVVEGIIAEAEAVADAKGIELPTDDVVGNVVEIARSHPEHKSSALQDVEAEKRTEIGDANGAIVAYAEEEGIDVPVNRTLTAVVRGLERGYLDG